MLGVSLPSHIRTRTFFSSHCNTHMFKTKAKSYAIPAAVPAPATVLYTDRDTPGGMTSADVCIKLSESVGNMRTDWYTDALNKTSAAVIQDDIRLVNELSQLGFYGGLGNMYSLDCTIVSIITDRLHPKPPKDITGQEITSISYAARDSALSHEFKQYMSCVARKESVRRHVMNTMAVISEKLSPHTVRALFKYGFTFGVVLRCCHKAQEGKVWALLDVPDGSEVE